MHGIEILLAAIAGWFLGRTYEYEKHFFYGNGRPAATKGGAS